MDQYDTYHTELVIDSDEVIEDIQDVRMEIEALNESVKELNQTFEKLPIPTADIKLEWVADDE